MEAVRFWGVLAKSSDSMLALRVLESTLCSAGSGLILVEPSCHNVCLSVHSIYEKKMSHLRQGLTWLYT